MGKVVNRLDCDYHKKEENEQYESNCEVDLGDDITPNVVHEHHMRRIVREASNIFFLLEHLQLHVQSGV